LRRFFRAVVTAAFIFLLAVPAFGADGLQVHFIDVGQADACLITCDGHAMMIDGGNSSDSQLVYSYLKKQNVTYLDYIVATHDDADHVGGLSAAVAYAKTNIGQAFAPYTDSTKERFQTFKRKLGEYGKTITVPETGAKYTLGGATFRILSGGGSGDNRNIILRLEYGKHSFLFMGDAGEDQEKAILSAKYQVESTVLKVGHHGSKTSTCYRFLKAAYPSYAVITVGKGNTYGHPTDEVLSRLRDEGATVLRTDNNGTVVFTSDGKELKYSVEKTASQEENLLAPGSTAQAQAVQKAVPETEAPTSGSAQESTYVLNTNTKKFHYPGCSSVGEMKEKNKKTVTDTRDHIISQGYVPCKRCKP